MAVEILVHHQEALGKGSRLEQGLFAFARDLEDLRGEGNELCVRDLGHVTGKQRARGGVEIDETRQKGPQLLP